MNAINEILKLKDGECWTWPESDYGKAEIWYKNGTYFLFEIPSFGGQPSFTNSFNKFDIDVLIRVVCSWT